MTASPEAVAAVQQALGCEHIDRTFKFAEMDPIRHNHCTRHGRGVKWTDRGCPVAVAAADAAVEVDGPTIAAKAAQSVIDQVNAIPPPMLKPFLRGAS